MKVEITVPESLSEITLGQYQKYLKLQDKNEDNHFLQSKLIEIFCNVPLDVVMKMRLTDTNAISDMLAELLKQEPELVKKTKINNIEYGFIPKLEDMSLGEYIDLDTNISDWENMHKVMNVLYRPIVGKSQGRYNIKDYEPNDGLHMKDIPLDCAVSSMIFFYRLGIDLSTTILSYLQNKEEQNLVQYLNSQPNGDGMSQYIHSLRETLQELNISLN